MAQYEVKFRYHTGKTFYGDINPTIGGGGGGGGGVTNIDMPLPF